MRHLYPNSIATRGRIIPTLERVATHGYLPEAQGVGSLAGSSAPIRELTQEQAVSVMSFWIRQTLRQNVRAVDRGSIVLLLQARGTMRLDLVREDYDRYVALITEEPWTSGYQLSEPALTEWIEESIRSVFTRT